MVALGTGARTTIEERVKSAGTNMIMVNAGNFSSGGVRMGQGNATHADARRRRRDSRSCPACSTSPPVNTTRSQVIAGNQNWSTQIQGTDVDLPLIRSWPTKYGIVLQPQDVTSARPRSRSSARVVSDTLFGAGRRSDRPDHPRSQPALQGHRRHGQQGPVVDGQDQDDTMFAPYTTVQKKLLGSPQHQQHHGLGGAVPIRSSRPRTQSRRRCAPATRFRTAIPTTSWSARSRKWPASRPRRPRR